MTDPTLKITFGRADDHEAAARERLRRAEAGERGDAIEQEVQFVLNLEDYADVERLMRQSNLELLEAIAAESPASISEAASLVDRDYRDVHRNLTELEDLGVIEFETDGASKRPMLRDGADELDISFRFGGSSERDTEPASA